jgi:serine/threonine protein kinase
MNPLSMLVARARGTWNFGPAINVIVMHYPDFLLVGVAVVISRVVTKLGQQVGKEREMGSYRLLTMLGKGGMGEVWRARHRMLARDAAIKLIQPEMLSGKSGTNALLIQRRFEQEAKTTALLRSPHTVQLYDFGITEDGVFYYVMELLDGIDLETLVKRFGSQPSARVVSILCQVCRSLSDAHRHGMIHRDIKPSNIFLCRMGGEYDFAVVQRITRPQSDHERCRSFAQIFEPLRNRVVADFVPGRFGAFAIAGGSRRGARWWPRWDSNPDFTDFDPVASASWTTGPCGGCPRIRTGTLQWSTLLYRQARPTVSA